MTKTGSKKRSRNDLRNLKAKVKRKDDKIARLQAKLQEERENSKKKALNHTDQVVRSTARQYQGTISRSLSPDSRSISDAELAAVQEILLELLK